MRNLLELDGEAIDQNKAITAMDLGVHFLNCFADPVSFAVKSWRMPK
jgi:hypothetical protein